MPESNTLRRYRTRVMFDNLGIFAELRGIRFIYVAYTRTAEEQKKLFDAGKSKCDGYAKLSQHQRDRARDIVIIDADGELMWESPDYETLGKFWESLGGTWGGRWKDPHDPGHFEA